MIESAIGGIAVPLFEQLWKAGGYVVGQVGQARQDIRNIEQILKASQAYQTKFQKRHGQFKAVKRLRSAPIRLDSIYTAVKFLDNHKINYLDGPQDLEERYREQDRQSLQTSEERYDGIDIAKEHQYLMVLGEPGVGKSSFLFKIGLEALKGKQGKLQAEKIPVFINLKIFRDDNIDLKTAIAKELEVCGFPNADAFTELSLNQGKLLLLLDGLDEVPTLNMSRMVEVIEDFVIQYDKNTFIASCRTAAYHPSSNQFTDVTIANFDDEQIEQFIQHWFDSDLDKETDTANHCWQLLQASENKAAKELAQTPLLLTFLCLVYEREKTIPSKISRLYGQALDILLSEWPTHKGLNKTAIHKDFYPKLEKALLSGLAYRSFREDRLFFSKTDITDFISSFLANTYEASEYLDSHTILQTIEVNQGLLVERISDTYSFSHLALQEYLTALHIVNHQLISELVNQHLTDERWKNVFLLVMGLMGHRGHELLEAIAQQIRSSLNIHPKVFNLIQWANKIAQDSLSGHSNFALRAIAIDIASALSSAITKLKILQATQPAFDIGASDRQVIRSIEVARSSSSQLSGISTIHETSNDKELNRINASEIANDIETALLLVNIQVVDDSSNDIVETEINLAQSSSQSLNQLEGGINFAKRSAKYLNQLKVVNTSAIQQLPSYLIAFQETISQDTSPTNDFANYAHELEKAWLKALNLKTESISLSSHEWQCFSKYLYVNALLLSCLRASTEISHNAWEAILEQQLLQL